MNLRTLVVHRHQRTRELLAQAARARGHDVHAAAALAEAREELGATELILLEWTGHAPAPAGSTRPVVIAVLEPLGARAAQEALLAGADDCVDAGVDAESLAVRLVWAERRLDELRERAVALEDLRRLHKAVETMQVGITITDLSGRIVYANPAEAEMHGYTVRDYVGQSARAHSPREEWRPLSAEQLRTLRKWGRERVRRRRDGTSFPVRLLSDVVTGPDGEPIGIVTVCEDISERRQAEEDVARTRERHRRFFEEDLAGAAILSPAGRIQECNPAFAQLVGEGSTHEAIGRELSAFLRQPEAAADLVGRVARDGRTQLYELELRRRDGAPLVAMASFVGVFDATAALSEINGWFVDVTEHRAVEEQLRQSQKMDAIGQLAGGVAHDFNNLLMVVWGFADQLLAQLPADDPMRSCVEPIAKAAEKGATLTRQLLAVSRRDPVQPLVLDLNTVVADMERMLGRLLGGSIRVQTSPFREPCNVKLDAGHAEQLLLNLVVNARDAMPRGGRLGIDTRAVMVHEREARRHVDLRPGPYVMLTVSDTGIGMDTTVLSHIFEPFYTTKPPGQGTGLGLATVYGIVKQAGGSIAVDSEPGRGTSFRVYLPQAEAPRVAAAPATVAPAAGEAARTVLVVQSEPDARALIRAYLTAGGFSVLEASQPEDALSLLGDGSARSLDLLLTDVVMARMSGPELARAVRARCPSARVLYMSGSAEGVLDENGRPDASAPLLHKPFRAAELQARVNEILARA